MLWKEKTHPLGSAIRPCLRDTVREGENAAGTGFPEGNPAFLSPSARTAGSARHAKARHPRRGLPSPRRRHLRPPSRCGAVPCRAGPDTEPSARRQPSPPQPPSRCDNVWLTTESAARAPLPNSPSLRRNNREDLRPRPSLLPPCGRGRSAPFAPTAAAAARAPRAPGSPLPPSFAAAAALLPPREPPQRLRCAPGGGGGFVPSGRRCSPSPTPLAAAGPRAERVPPRLPDAGLPAARQRKGPQSVGSPGRRRRRLLQGMPVRAVGPMLWAPCGAA